MTAIRDLADAVGLSSIWRDAEGRQQDVRDDALAAILGPLGYPAESDADRRRSHERLAAEAALPPRLLTGDAGAPIALPPALAGANSAELVRDGAAETLDMADGMLPPITRPGYYRLRIAGQELTLAVAPGSCVSLSSFGRRLWGTALQIPSLQDREQQGFGDFGHLARAVRTLAASGADAVAISPVHALYPGDGVRFSPYSPSSRLFLNVALADPASAGLPGYARQESGALIDWETALPQRLAALRATFAGLGAAECARIANWAEGEGDALHRHALFDALYVHFADSAKGWQDWPAAYHDPESDVVQRFAVDNRDEIAFHIFAQWLARHSLAGCQSAAKAGGMAIGLISDLAIGVDPGGSDAWGMGDCLLDGLSIGAPPDPLGPNGQYWGLTGFSPRGLKASGFAPWIAMLRAALADAGGVRIDHGFGLERLWVVPQGERADAGAYLSYPFDDLLRLVTLESHLAGAIIVAEDLGTRPIGFAERIAERGMAGMRVLWFERDGEGRFAAPDSYAPESVAMTGTHDTPTVAGWWRGVDMAWNKRLGRGGTEEAERARDRPLLWQAIGGGGGAPQPNDNAPVVDAAIAHIANAASGLAIVPVEDILGLEEQVNLPGTVDGHPNWRRRLPGPLETLLGEPAPQHRITLLKAARPR